MLKKSPFGLFFCALIPTILLSHSCATSFAFLYNHFCSFILGILILTHPYSHNGMLSPF